MSPYAGPEAKVKLVLVQRMLGQLQLRWKDAGKTTSAKQAAAQSVAAASHR